MGYCCYSEQNLNLNFSSKEVLFDYSQEGNNHNRISNFNSTLC